MCCLPGELIAAEGGPKSVSELVVGDRVCDQHGALKRVKGTSVHWYSGEIIRVYIDKRMAPLTVTANHPVVTMIMPPKTATTSRARLLPTQIPARDVTIEHSLMVPRLAGLNGDQWGCNFPSVKGQATYGMALCVGYTECEDYDGYVHCLQVEGGTFLVAALAVGHCDHETV